MPTADNYSSIMTQHHCLSIMDLAQDNLLQSLIQAPALRLVGQVAAAPTVRLIRLDEINEERHLAYRQALANVYASIDPEQPTRLLYLLDGGPTGVALYFGVVTDTTKVDLHEAIKNLRGALEGQLPGINFGEEVTPEAKDGLLHRLCHASQQGVMLGAPTAQTQDDPNDEQDYQGVDRLVRALQSGIRPNIPDGAGWQLTVISQPIARRQVRQLIDAAYSLSSRLAALVRTSVQASGNTSRQKSASTGTSQAVGRSESQSDSRGKNASETLGSNAGQSTTRGKSESGTDGKNWGKSSNSNSSSSSRGESSGGSESKTYGTNESLSKTSGTTESKTFGTNESSSKTTGTSLTDTSTENFSLSDTEGSTLGITQEFANKRAEHLLEYLDKQLITRLQKGLTKGLFHSAIYLTAENNSTYQRLKNTLRATFQGSEATMSPLEVYDLPPNARGQLLCLPNVADPLSPDRLLFHNLCAGAQSTLGSLLTADELAIVASLPQHELQGIRRRKTVDFIVDLPDVPSSNALDLGAVIDRGRQYPNNPVRLNRADFDKHVFVTGVTGAGKTTTCLNLLLETDLPFLVIEPAKTEYRELATHLPHAISYYRPNGDKNQSLRINPFALVRSGQHIKSHAGFLKNVFAAVFPMEASMPMMVEAAILAAYEDKGWDIDENEFLLEGNPFDPITRAWPTLSEMIRQLDRLIPTYGLGKEFEEKYRGSLVSRLRSLTDGNLGRVLDVPQSIDFLALIERRAVIELEELQGGDEKALLMALLLGGINEAIRASYDGTSGCRHLTLIEEAHRLLSRPEPGDKAASMAVEAFADMLAEVRKYGAGLIIADQIPAKLIPDIIKNTHSKIVHRLFAEDDRRSMGEAMMMDEAQRNFLPNLRKGEAIVFCGGWHGPAHAAIRGDRAQTDARPMQEHELLDCHIQQFWRERARYYPQFCQLRWLSEEGDDPKRFADFLRETRQAHNQFLYLICPECEQEARGKSAFLRLKTWLERWKPLAHEHQRDYRDWQAQATQAWPESILTAAWLALLLDANPRAHPQEKDVPPLLPKTQEHRNSLVHANELLLHLLTSSPTLADLKQEMRAPRARDLQAHCHHLARFKSF